jgi:quercetin dioxygenase-like cupin family protein
MNVFRFNLLALGSGLLAAALVLAAPSSAALSASSPGINASTLKWGAAPPFLPPGAQIAVLDGDPGKAVPITLRLRFPAGYEVPAHWHPTEENLTVLSGRLNVGMGDVLDQKASTALIAGGFVSLGGHMNHYVWASEDTVVQLHMNGPFEITYADPALDPRK